MTSTERSRARFDRLRGDAAEWQRWNWVKGDIQELVSRLEASDADAAGDLLCSIAMRAKRDGLV